MTATPRIVRYPTPRTMRDSHFDLLDRVDRLSFRPQVRISVRAPGRAGRFVRYCLESILLFVARKRNGAR